MSNSLPGIARGAGKIALVAKELAKQHLDQARNGLAVIDIAGCEAEREQLTPIIDHQVQLEAIKPAGGGLAPLR